MNFLALVLTFWFAAAHEPSVRFLENPSVVSTGAVYLKDIATFEHLESADEARVGEIQVAESIMELQKMSSREIMKRIKPSLRAFENQCHCKVQVTLPHALVIHGLPGNFAVEKVQATMESELSKDCPICRFEFSDLNIIRGRIPDAYTRWNIDMRKNEWRGPTMVRVYFDDDAFNPLILQTLVKIHRPVMSLQQPAAIGSQVAATDVRTDMLDVTYEKANFATETDLAGKEVKRTLAKGHRLTLDDLIARNMIRIGQPVAVEVKNAAFTIEMAGVAMKTGKLGDTIPVKINKTQKSISAEIISEARVRM